MQGTHLGCVLQRWRQACLGVAATGPVDDSKLCTAVSQSSSLMHVEAAGNRRRRWSSVYLLLAVRPLIGCPRQANSVIYADQDRKGAKNQAGTGLLGGSFFLCSVICRRSSSTTALSMAFEHATLLQQRPSCCMPQRDAPSSNCQTLLPDLADRMMLLIGTVVGADGASEVAVIILRTDV